MQSVRPQLPFVLPIHVISVAFFLLLLQICPALATQDPPATPAQEAVVTHNVRLRPAPSTDNKPLMTLTPGEELELLDPAPTTGFYHVETESGDQGWVSTRYVRVTPPPLHALSAMAAGAPPASTISESWNKPAPNKTTFTGPGGNCPWNGNKLDPDTFIRKNRTDLPAESDVHDVDWSAIHDLPFPIDTKLRAKWTPAHLQEIARVEGVALRTTGYLVAIKPQNGNKEGTNCRFSLASETDTHMALVGEVGGAEKDSVVIEYTPRFLKSHPHWNSTVLSKYRNNDIPVRVTGWLMLDPDHRNHLNKYRFTLWEIHPITKIEIFQNNSWQDLDAPLTP
ncbi:MAG: SH3 domain-containing protein [Acidobacteriota bacterium]|nr:SH3 domain-containing protein [Acidobacteriota bacterium]